MTTSRTIKVSIPITLKIDIDAWQTEYGCESAAEVRADVKAHAASSLRQHFADLGVLA